MLHVLHKKKTDSYADIVRSAGDGIGLEDILKSARRILIKPNFVTQKTSDEGVTTSIELVRSIVELANDVSSAEIVVGESALLDTETVFRELNVYDLAHAGCRVENLEKGDWVEIEPPFSLLFDRLLIPRVAFESDVIINVGKMKTHQLTGVTLGIKNFFGLLSRGGRQYAHIKDIDKGIADIYSYFEANKTVVTFIDALVALSGRRGPVIGDPVEPRCLIAGTNTVVCDAAAARIMGVIPGEIPHIRLSAELFNIDLDDCSAYFQNIDEAAPAFDVPTVLEAPGHAWARLGRFMHTRLFYKYPVPGDVGACTGCKRCERICPRRIVAVHEKTFTYDASQCVHCLSCVEACDTGAITSTIRNRALFFLLRSCWRTLKAAKRLLTVSRKTGVDPNGV